MTPEEQGQIEKLKNQFARARKLADCIHYQLNSNKAEVETALRDRPESNWWEQLALVVGITTPSAFTQSLTMLILEDRESIPKMKAKPDKSRGKKNAKRTASGR